MANRKVLINRHTSGSLAPAAKDMYLGEIAVAHETGKETLFTKNNAGDMVPFISCAQTITMISNAISAADVTYDVKAADGDAHVEVVSGGTEKAKVFTVSSKDVQSKAAFDAYSAATDATIKQNYNTLSGAIDDVLSIITTSITGDSIIKVQPTTSGAGAYNLSHKEATAVTGFNKLSTDAYGHVTASTAVVASDIKTLGFEDSAWTEQKITDAIEALDSAISASSAGKYFTALAIENGKLVAKEEASIPVLEVESAGTGNVVEAITVNGHKISYTTTSVATSHDIEELSAATKSFSAGTYSEFNSAFTAINKLSADTEAADGKVFTSAKTYSDELIAALDSSKVATDNKHYITAITIEDGKLSTIGQAEIPVLASAVTGTGNVVTDIAVSGHTITFAKDMAVASEDDLKAVSGIVDTFSAATVAEFNSVFTAIQAMDKEASAVAGKVVTTVAQEDGKVTETKANVKDLQLGGYVKDAAATGDIAGTDTINAALSKLENKVGANKITNADGSIVVTEPAGTATTTDVKVNIKSGEKVIKLDGKGGGLYTNLNLVKITESLPATVKERYEFRDSDNNKIGESIDIAKDSHIVSITYNEATQKLIYTYLDASGATQTAEVDMAHLILETEVENGIQSVNGKLSIKLDTTGDDTGDGKFLTVGADGLKLDGVTDAINAAVSGLNYADTAVAGQYVTEVDETNGVISVKRANVSDAVLNGYAKGEKPASTAIAATDDVKGAIAKLEHQVDAAKAAATTKVVKGTDAGNNMTIVPTTGDDNSVTYTVNLTDVASKAALDAEIAARKAVDGQTGQTYAANTGTTYITGATSLNDADVKLDAALKAVSDKVNAAKVTEGSSVENFVALALDTATTAGTTALTINDSALKTKIDEINSAITAETKARQDAIADLDSTAQTSGSGYFLTSVQLADGKITAATQNDKVNSASTAAHADAATQVDQKLTFADDANDVEYDGSKAKTITFGTACTSTGITNERSMSITNGVVDVEVIDCGEY